MQQDEPAGAGAWVPDGLSPGVWQRLRSAFEAEPSPLRNCHWAVDPNQAQTSVRLSVGVRDKLREVQDVIGAASLSDALAALIFHFQVMANIDQMEAAGATSSDDRELPDAPDEWLDSVEW